MKPVGVSSLVMAVIFLGIVTPYILPNFNTLPFDTERWKTWEEGNSESDWDLRWRMSSSFIKNQRLVGMERSEVVDLLGVPYSETDDEAYYDLGITGLGAQAGVLILYFDQTNHVTNAVKVKH